MLRIYGFFVAIHHKNTKLDNLYFNLPVLASILPNFGDLQRLHSLRRAQFTLPHLFGKRLNTYMHVKYVQDSCILSIHCVTAGAYPGGR